MLLLVTIGLAALDSLGIVKRAVGFYRQPQRDWSVFIRDVLRSKPEEHWATTANRYEMIGLVEADDENDEHVLHNHHEHEHRHQRRESPMHEDGQVVFALGDDEEDDLPPPRSLAKEYKPRRPSLLIRQHYPSSRTSTGSEGTLQDTPSSSSSPNFPHKPHGSRTGAYDQSPAVEKPSLMWQTSAEAKRMTVGRFLEICLTWVRRTQVVIAYVVVLTGLATYTVGIVRRWSN
jgi:hypothetical protein